MNTIKKLFSITCIIAYLIPVYGQKDTLTSDGLYHKYNISFVDRISTQAIELNRTTKRIGLTYKVLPQYVISDLFSLIGTQKSNPEELLRTTNNGITSQWTHKDGECILFIKCFGLKSWIDKSIDQIPQSDFDWIKQTLGMGFSLNKTTEQEMQEIKKKINIWPSQKAKKIFNAQYVITYPIENKKAVYMGKYTHKRELIMIKWGEHLTVSFLVTKKGNRNIEKYIKDVEEAFWFED